MKSIFELKIDRDGYHGISISHDELVKSKDGVDNPYAYNLGLNKIMTAILRMTYSETQSIALEFYHMLCKDAEILEEKLKQTADKYGI